MENVIKNNVEELITELREMETKYLQLWQEERYIFTIKWMYTIYIE